MRRFRGFIDDVFRPALYVLGAVYIIFSQFVIVTRIMDDPSDKIANLAVDIQELEMLQDHYRMEIARNMSEFTDSVERLQAASIIQTGEIKDLVKTSNELQTEQKRLNLIQTSLKNAVFGDSQTQF